MGGGVDLILNTVNGEVKTDTEERLAYNGQFWINEAPKNQSIRIFLLTEATISALNIGEAHKSNSYSQKRDSGIMATELFSCTEKLNEQRIKDFRNNSYKSAGAFF